MLDWVLKTRVNLIKNTNDTFQQLSVGIILYPLKFYIRKPISGVLLSLL